MNQLSLSGFKAYDLRGKLPSEINSHLFYAVGRGFATEFLPKKVVVGFDIRYASLFLTDYLIAGLRDSGVDVVSIGLCGTEEVYFHTTDQAADGGIMVTASHNPVEYAGMKFVGKGSAPISYATGLKKLSERIAQQDFLPVIDKASGEYGALSFHYDKSAYIEKILSFIDITNLRDKAGQQPLKVVVNAGNGTAGPVLDRLESHLPIEMIKIHNRPDSQFPNGIPNPLLYENRLETARAVRENSADLGVAWDGDFDRCFFFDHQGEFVDPSYLVGLLAKQILSHSPGETVVTDTRMIWNNQYEIDQAGGRAVMSPGGHSPMKETMLKESAIYGGEMSAHYYFRAFNYCDSGMIPWLLVVELLVMTGQSLSELIAESKARFPCSGEQNFSVQSTEKVLRELEAHYRDSACTIDHTDGLSLEFDEWRINVRASNTEPLLRLNLEVKEDTNLLEAKLLELRELIALFG